MEEELEYIPNRVFKNFAGTIFHTEPAFKYTKEIEYESGYYEEKVTGISESGRKTNTTARFYVNTNENFYS